MAAIAKPLPGAKADPHQADPHQATLVDLVGVLVLSALLAAALFLLLWVIIQEPEERRDSEGTPDRLTPAEKYFVIRGVQH